MGGPRSIGVRDHAVRRVGHTNGRIGWRFHAFAALGISGQRFLSISFSDSHSCRSKTLNAEVPSARSGTSETLVLGRLTFLGGRMELDLDQGIAVLERTPLVLGAMLTGLDPAWTDATEGPETWSPYIIVGHLIHGERTDWIPRAQIILAQGPQRRFTPYDRFAQFHESQGKSLAALLDEFARLRAESLATLAGWHLTHL